MCDKNCRMSYTHKMKESVQDRQTDRQTNRKQYPFSRGYLHAHFVTRNVITCTLSLPERSIESRSKLCAVAENSDFASQLGFTQSMFDRAYSPVHHIAGRNHVTTYNMAAAIARNT